MKFSIKDFFSKCDQIRRKQQIWSHLLKKYLIKNFTVCAAHLVRKTHAYKVNSFICNLVSIDLSLPIKDQFSYQIETSQLTCLANYWARFSVIVTLVVNELIESIP